MKTIINFTNTDIDNNEHHYLAIVDTSALGGAILELAHASLCGNIEVITDSIRISDILSSVASKKYISFKKEFNADDEYVYKLWETHRSY